MDSLAELLTEAVPLAVLAILLGYLGSKAVPMVRRLPDSRWRSLYLITAWLHPVCVGALFGLSPELPVPAAMGDSWEASILWYALAGVASLPMYRWFMGRLEKKAANA